MKPDGSFECQHGKVECEMNTVEACVIHYYPNRSTWWPFIVCLEGYGPNQTYSIAEKCAGEQNITWPEVKACANGTLGKSLEVMYYKETSSLDPPHAYTPWILINGKHVDRTQIIQQICDAYTGPNKPEACNTVQHLFSPVGGCYRQPT
jgi:interferon gamma-inducible protein 30